MALHLSGRHKCRMCHARLVSAETVERARMESGGHILYRGVRRLACPTGCPVSLYDFSRAEAVGPAPERTAPILPPETSQPDGKRLRKSKRSTEDGAESVKDSKRGAEEQGEEEQGEKEEDSAEKTEQVADAEGAESKAPAQQQQDAGPGAETDPKTESKDSKDSKDSKPETGADEPKQEASREEVPAATEESTGTAAKPAAATPAAPKSPVPAVLGKAYMIVGFAFAYALFIMTVIVADIPPSAKLSYSFVLGGVAVLNALAFFMPTRSRDEETA